LDQNRAARSLPFDDRFQKAAAQLHAHARARVRGKAIHGRQTVNNLPLGDTIRLFILGSSPIANHARRPCVSAETSGDLASFLFAGAADLLSFFFSFSPPRRKKDFALFPDN
jgi:hypothetical protein